jgi:protoporphyrinogen oxidase
LAEGGTLHFDAAILTIPCPHVIRACPQLSADEKRRLSRVVYQGVQCASLLLRRPLGGFYVTNITEPWVPFTAVIEMTALVDRARFGGHALVYLPRYLTQEDERWTWTDGDIRQEFLGALQRMYPDLRPDDVPVFQVARARVMQAVTTLNYSQQVLPPAPTSLPHVFVANSAQIVNGTLNVNETVDLGNRKAEEIASRLARHQAASAAAGESFSAA